MIKRNSILSLTFCFIFLISSCEKEQFLNNRIFIDNKLILDNGPYSFQRIVGGEKLDGFYSVKSTSDGGFIFCGFTENQNASERDILVLKTNFRGETDWLKTYTNYHSDYGWFIDSTNDDGYITSVDIPV